MIKTYSGFKALTVVYAYIFQISLTFKFTKKQCCSVFLIVLTKEIIDFEPEVYKMVETFRWQNDSC